MTAKNIISLVISLIAMLDAKRVVPSSKTEVNMDGPHISCSVCNKAIDALYTATAEARRDAPYNKLDEGKIQEIVEGVCKNDEPGGEW
jgi:NMD protein affecting ribosome stability and mRNA decay